MPDLRPTDRPKVSLEQLLKLKRSERPDPAFWEGFDRELHRRQLASVVATPSWRTRLARSLLVGVRRAIPITAAAAAAVGGFLILQRPAEESAGVADTAATAPIAAEPAAVEEAPPAPVSPVLVADAASNEAEAPSFVRPVTTSEPRFVVHEFAAAAAPSRTYVSVTSPNTFSSSAYDASLQTVNTLSAGSERRASDHPAAGNF